MMNKFFGLFNKKEKSPKKETKTDAAEPAKAEVSSFILAQSTSGWVLDQTG